MSSTSTTGSYADDQRGSAATSVHWRVALGARLDALGRWFEGRLVAVSADDVGVPAERFLDPDHLRTAIAAMVVRSDRSARFFDSSSYGDLSEDSEELDLRIAASRFTRQYAAPVTAVALAGLAAGIGLDVSIGRCRMAYVPGSGFRVAVEISDERVLRCAERPCNRSATGEILPTLAELRAYVWEQLYANHLALVIERVLDVVNVSPTLLWSNAAEWVGMVHDAAGEYLESGPLRDWYTADCQALLGAPALPGLTGDSPLRNKLHWEPVPGDEFPQVVQTRRMCCLTYYLEDRYGRLCGNCPYLPVTDRAALVRERHGVPLMGPDGRRPSGPAEVRAVEVGLAKLGRRQYRPA